MAKFLSARRYDPDNEGGFDAESSDLDMKLEFFEGVGTDSGFEQSLETELNELNVSDQDDVISDQVDVKSAVSSSSETSANSNKDAPKNVYLAVSSKEEYREFLQHMLLHMVENLNPIHSGLMDDLMGLGVVQCDAYSRVKEKATRRDQARELWTIFVAVDWRVFKRTVFPVLLQRFPNVLPPSFCTTDPPCNDESNEGDDDNVCLHHYFKLGGWKPIEFADMLKSNGCISDGEFIDILRNACSLPNATVWSLIFDHCCKHSPSQQWCNLEKSLESSLTSHKKPIPGDLRDQLSRGLVCTCRLPEYDLPGRGFPDVKELCENQVTACDFQSDGSQHLGSDNPDFDIKKTLSQDYLEWARSKQLTDRTLQQLLKEGIKSKSDLLHCLSPPDRMQRYLARSHLPLRQLSLLEEAVKSLEGRRRTRGFSSLVTGERDLPKCLVLVGETGTGKSTSGNTLLGPRAPQKFKNSLSMVSGTTNVKRLRSRDNRIEVIDLPGLMSTNSTDEEICKILVQGLLESPKTGPNAVLYALKIGDKYTKDAYRSFLRLKAIFGDDITRHMIILFTHGDKLVAGGVSIEDYIKESPDDFKKVFGECGERFFVLDNTEKGDNAAQFRKLLMLMEKVERETQSQRCQFFSEDLSQGSKDQKLEDARRRLREVLKERDTKPGEPPKPSWLAQLKDAIMRFLQYIRNIFSG